MLYMPKSLAPNLITTIGLICVLLSYIIMLPYGTHFSESIPSYILFISALLIFAYQTLDAIDGKQARRVKASSPLGMLFDHGCDSMSTSLLVLTITQGMGLGLTASSIFLYIGAQTTFFIIT